MHVSEHLTEDQITDLAMRAVHKINTRKQHGVTLCSTNEIIAMAAYIVRVGPLIPPQTEGHTNE